YWVANVIFTRGGTTLVHDLAARSDVAAIEADDASNWIESDEVAKTGVTKSQSPAAVEPGVVKVNAPQLWAMGFTGQGIVIGNQDTGMRWTHNALKPHYRGWNGSTADHNYNWHDSIHSDIDGDGTNPCGFNAMAPCDDHAADDRREHAGGRDPRRGLGGQLRIGVQHGRGSAGDLRRELLDRCDHAQRGQHAGGLQQPR